MAAEWPTALITPQDLETCLRVLQVIADDPSVMDAHDRFKSLVAKIHRQAKKGKRHARRAREMQADRQLVETTAVVRQQLGVGEPAVASNETRGEYHRPRRCYACKQDFVQVHAFYHLLCPDCASFNWAKRHQCANLSGRIAVITGGRIKIGYQTGLKLLRDGAHLIITTRFPRDAETRFRQEQDSGEWWDRLEVAALDLRDVPGVEAFAQRLLDDKPHLDVLIHNAAQTIKRPLAFYRHLLEQEALTAEARALACRQPTTALIEARPGYQGHLPGTHPYFPPDSLDRDGQQVDQRPVNSWRLRLGQVGTVELLEVMLANVVAPFVLTNHLLPALLRSPHPRRFIVSVSAMEGVFAWQGKTAFHPHTNMAKAALNMMTRTTAAELAQQGVYLNSVDPGWISDEKPLPGAERAREEQGFYVPLDPVDSAARIYDPIARGLNDPAEPVSGHYLKDYVARPW